MYSLVFAENQIEEYDAELERMNNAMTIENQGLQYDNKQLNSLLKEYEQTLENIMSSFRKRAVSRLFAVYSHHADSAMSSMTYSYKSWKR